MKKTFTLFVSLITSLLGFCQFTPGNLVVLRVGNGIDSLVTSGSPVFLDEFTPAGVLVQSVPLPTEPSGANKRLILNGTATSEGMLQRSPSGLYLTVAGYDTALGGPKSVSGTPAATTNRSIARISYNESIDLTTAFSDFASSGNPRSAITTDGNKFWMLGSVSGVRFGTLGTSTSTQLSTSPTNLRSFAIAGDQLYISTASGSAVRIGAVGTGIPEVAGNTITNLPGLPVNTSPYQFVFFDLNAAVAGPDVLYIANDDANGIQKFSLVGGTWTLNGTTSSDQDYRGITGDYINGGTGGVVLFSTRKGGNSSGGGGELVTISDAGGYNEAFTGEPSLLAVAADSTAFRGIAFAPLQNPLPLSLMSFTASKISGGTVLVWTTNKEYSVSHFELEKSIDGRMFKTIDKQSANGNALYNEYRSTDREVLVAAAYYRLKIIDRDGAIRYSQVLKISNNGKSGFSVRPNPANASITIEHPVVKGKAIIRILLNDGRQVAAYTAQEGSFQTSMNVGQLYSGNYRVVFENGVTRLSTSLLKK